MDYNDKYIYRIQQTSIYLSNTTTVPQLTFTVWSGM